MNGLRKRKGGRLLSMLLALTVLLSGKGISVNGEAAYPDSSDALQDEVEVSTSVSGNEERGNPANPVHSSCNSGNFDTTAWSYVYFGSYPQSEVTDSATITAIDGAIEKVGITADAGMDVEVGETKYRRISASDTNDEGGNFDEAENNGYRYFKWEPIKWKVLQNDGNTLFVVADKAIDCKAHNDELEYSTWETSTIREWLNESFYQVAFSSSEQGGIVEQTVVNAQAGDDSVYTYDKVYLLSYSEVVDETYGFCSRQYIEHHSVSRRVKTSDYANARGTKRCSRGGYEGNCCWWLRNTGGNYYWTDSVNYYGDALHTVSADLNYIGVCPALHIELSSDLWFMADDGTSSEGGNGGEGGPANPVHSCCAYKEDSTDFSYVYFGSYPQSEVIDEETQKAIEEAISVSGNSVDVEDDRYVGIDGMDVWLNGTKYRRIRQYDNSCYYFKWERIKWKVLQNDGNTLFVVADKPIDSKYYDKYGVVETTWETSAIRNWLNDSFYGTAFSSGEQNAIVTQDVVNEDNPEYGTEGGNNTRDKIYLLSIGEVENETYGFCSDYDNNCLNDSMSRTVEASDYAEKIGFPKGGSAWWLRSSGCISRYAACVTSSGSVYRNGFLANGYSGGACPALHINLSSDLWFMTDDGTSGEGGNGGGSKEEKILTGLQASKTKTEYVQGEQLNLDDLTVTAVYGELSETLPSGSYTTNAGNISMNTPGRYALEISYTEKGITQKAAITITVKEKTDDTTPQPDDSTNNKPVKVTKLTITAPSKKPAAGKKIKLAVKAEPENAADKTVTWKSSNTKYATVDKNGKVVLKKAGAGKSVTITATANDGSGKKATVKLKIMKHAVKSIKLKVPKKTLKTGKSMTIKATVKTTGSSANKTLKWTSSNTKYAIVSKSGKVTAKKAGKGKSVTITAAATDGSGKKAKVKVKIK